MGDDQRLPRRIERHPTAHHDGQHPLGGTFSLGSDIANPAILRGDGGEVFIVTADRSLKSVTLTPAGDGLTLGAEDALHPGDGASVQAPMATSLSSTNCRLPRGKRCAC